MNKLASRLILIAALGAAFAVGAILNGAPVRNVSARPHPNIAAAQKLCAQAFEKIIAAQKANEYDLAGHAARAKDFIEQANAELKLAAESLDNNNSAK